MSSKDAALAHQWVKEADRILVTASNGLAISEGLNLFANDQKLKQVLGDLVDKYQLTSLLQAFSYPYQDQLDYWRMVARVAEFYNYNYKESPYLKQIKTIIAGRPYFIWTSNTDHHFVQAGFDKVLEVEGNWMTATCAEHPDEHGPIDIKEQLHQIFQKDQRGKLSNADIPTCDQCHSPLTLNVAGPKFKPDQAQVEQFKKFIDDSRGKKLLLLELGIGPNNQMIKAPSMELIASYPDSRYITINKGELNIYPEIASRSIGFSSSIADAFKEIRAGQSYGAKTQGPDENEQPQLTADQQRQQEKMMQNFYPNYMIDAPFNNNYPMYVTLDRKHPALLHGTEHGQYWMYSIGDSATVHCFTPEGHYYRVELGLNKALNQVHGFYVNPGTLIAIEANEDGAGFSQLSTNLPLNDNGRILVPKVDRLVELYPQQKELIHRLTLKEDGK